MNIALKQSVLAALLLTLVSYPAWGQGTFQNLDFEQANVPDVPAGEVGSNVRVADGVPGWTVYLGGNQQSTMFHNNMSLGAAEVAIDGPAWYSSQILEGRYTVSLQPSTAGPPTSAAIGQTAEVPMGAESLTFFGRGSFMVSFAGQSVPLVTVGGTAAYTVFGADITAIAGHTGELRFQGGGLLDAIQFSAQAIPEPGGFGLWALGGLLIGCRVVQRR